MIDKENAPTDPTRIIEAIRRADRCPCEKCQKRKKELEDWLEEVNARSVQCETTPIHDRGH